MCQNRHICTYRETLSCSRSPSGSFHVGNTPPFRLISYWKRLLVDFPLEIRDNAGNRAEGRPRALSAPAGTELVRPTKSR